MPVTAEQLQQFIDKYYDPTKEKRGRTGVTGAPDQDAYTALRTAYLTNLDPKDLFGLPISISTGRHPTMLSVAGLLHDGHRTEEEIAGLIADLWAEYCDREPRAGEIDEIAHHAITKKPAEFTLPENHPSLEQPTFGLKAFGTQKELDEFKAKMMPKPDEKEISYPLEVWKGTDYEEYAERAKMDTYVPLEFHIEALKTIVGALAGSQMYIPNEGAGRSPRFYTVLMADPGVGKNTAIEDIAINQFIRGNNEGLVAVDPNSLLWPPQTKIEKNSCVQIGACLTKASSASGFHHYVEGSPQPRVIFVHTELTELFEKFGIDGSGGALMSVVCDLYDGVSFSVPALAKQKPFGGDLQLSLLAGVQPQRWDDICGGRGIETSGLSERFNLIPTTERRTKAGLGVPKFSGFRDRFLDRIRALTDAPFTPEATPAAKAYIEEWFQELRKPMPGEDLEDPVSRGRINVLAWKNALHWSWVMGRGSVDIDAAERGAKLGAYQLAVRNRYRALTGNNAVAKASNAITRFLKKYEKEAWVSLRDVRRGVNAARLGPVFASALNHLVTMHLVEKGEEKSMAGRAQHFLRRTE